MSISRLAKNLRGSEIIKIAGEINELKKQGKRISNLTIGDFDSSIFPIPTDLKEKIKQAYDHNETSYPPADGIPALRKSVSDFLKTNYSLDVTTDEIQISSGSRPLIYATYLTVVDPGDKVVYPAPSWNNNHYCDLVNAQGIAVSSQSTNHFMPTADDLRPHLKGAALLALCSPLNPTGTMFSKKDLEDICDLVIEENKSRKADEKPLYVLFDQIYSLLTFGEHKHYNPVTLRPEIKDYVIYIDGASKCFASTGVRVGWGFGPAPVISKMRTMIMHMGAWAPRPEQVAVASFLQNTSAVNEFLHTFKEKIRKSLNSLYTSFQELKNQGLPVDAIEPMGAIYLTVKIDVAGKTTPDGSILTSSEDINFYLIREAKAAFVPFSAFGTSSSVNWFRASVGGCSLEDIQAMMPRIKEALLKLK